MAFKERALKRFFDGFDFYGVAWICLFELHELEMGEGYKKMME